MKTLQEQTNVVLEKQTPLTTDDKALFAYFGEGAKIKPPYRILNPHRIRIGDRTSIQEHAMINAFEDLSYLHQFIAEEYKNDFDIEEYKYNSFIDIGRENQIGRFFFVSCTASIVLEENVLLSERVFLGDNNHSFKHPHVPIMQQPNQQGEPILIRKGSWIGVGASILKGTEIGCFSVVSTNSVVKGKFPDRSVIGPERAKLLYTLDKSPMEL
jgi:acetyltransferase-like isoleucine patch superfamily enzyme